MYEIQENNEDKVPEPFLKTLSGQDYLDSQKQNKNNFLKRIFK